LAGNAGHVITLDTDILILGTLSGVRMLAPGEFLAALQDAGLTTAGR
jgi:predicted nucleic acid-binding protein